MPSDKEIPSQEGHFNPQKVHCLKTLKNGISHVHYSVGERVSYCFLPLTILVTAVVFEFLWLFSPMSTCLFCAIPCCQYH